MDPLAIQQTFDLAVRHHQAGRLQEAEQLYRQILATQPEHSGAIHYLGVIAYQSGRPDAAVELLRRAIALEPNNPEANINLGNALKDQGRLDEAIAAFGRAIALNPKLLEAFFGLGNALAAKGRLDEAIAAFRQAIALNPDLPQPYNNLGIALTEKGQFDEAIAACRQAIGREPGLPEAPYNLGNALQDKGQLADAIAAYRQAIALRPDYAAAHFNLANALKDNRQLDEAIAAFRQAIALRADYAEAYCNLGSALQDKGQYDDAIAAFRRAISLRPTLPEAHNNLGNALKDIGQIPEAIDAFRQAIALRPDLPAAYSNLLFGLSYHPTLPPEAIYRELRELGRRFTRTIQPHPNNRDPKRRIKIGYVSPDFRQHCQSFFTLPLLSHHDHNQFEIYGYANVSKEDELTHRTRGYCEVWRPTVGQTDDQLAKQIREDQIDILVDLTMHMVGGRPDLFAQKPAPIQVAWLAYPGTTGLTAIDYRLTDPHLDPPGEHDHWYSEKSIRLPETFWCYDPLTDQPEANALPANRNGYITFGCLNNFCKVTDQTLSLWSRVLKALPTSRLILLSPRGEHRRSVLTRLDIEPGRVEFIEQQQRDPYLRTYHRIDICLDTFPYNGHTTSLDALWMGVPVMSCEGQAPVGRAALSQNKNLGLAQELVGLTHNEFVSLTLKLSGNLNRLAELRGTLRKRISASALMDGRRFARNVESAYRQIWRTWCESGSVN